MKQKALSVLLATAFAGVATTASAGVIQASYKNYASEVFGTDAVVLTAPTINYALALPLSGTVANPNSFSITWTLTNGGEYTIAPAPANISLSSPSNAQLLNPSTVTLSADKKAITATFTVTQNYTVGSQIVLGSGGPVSITKVGTILGAPALSNGCGNDIASVNVAVKLTNAAGVEFDSNFSAAPLSNTTPIVQASVALSVKPQDSQNYSAAVGVEKGKVDVLLPSLGLMFTAGAGGNPVVPDVTGVSTTLLNIGAINITDRAVLFDLDGTNPYSSKGTAFATSVGTGAGVVEAESLIVNVSGKFLTTANGGSFFVSVLANCSTTLQAGTIAADGATATVTVSNAGLIALRGATATDPVKPAYLCYATTGAKVIPTSVFAVTGGSLTKFAASLEAPNPVCPGPIYTLVANGVRIDVRNYVPNVARATSGGWYSVIRVINSDETQTVSPVIQVLKADGTLGANASLDVVNDVQGKNGPFKPREVRYYTSSALDGAMNANASAAVPTYSAPGDTAANARLRITAASSSLRVQNYIYNPGAGNFQESSSAQGDDGPDYARAADATNK
ncbi:MAG: hypothetical protein ABIN96_00015 [Rubrivivax sp.]